MTCPQCDAAFEPARPWQRFCSTACRNTYHANRRKAALTELALRAPAPAKETPRP